MTHDRPYYLLRHIPAPRLRDADSSVRPHTYGVRVGFCAAFATESCRPTACIPAAPFRHTPYSFRPRQKATVWRNLQQHPHSGETHTFSAKERDAETGLSYFGARYYSSDLSIWLSVDPMSDKYPSLSPYVYCADNPVKLVDPDGEEVWKPDIEGNLFAEEGDNKESLADFLHCSIDEAGSLLSEQGYNSNENIKDGSKVILDNVFTRSIKSFSNAKDDYYNCWGSSYYGVLGLPIENGCDIPCANIFDSYLSSYFESVDGSEAQFGKTIIRFESKTLYMNSKYDKYAKNGCISRTTGAIGSSSHAVVYYGTDNNNNVYVYTKNGYSRKPMVVPLKSSNLIGYGDVIGIGGESGYYNRINN